MSEKLFNKLIIPPDPSAIKVFAEASNTIPLFSFKIKQFFILGKASDATAHFIPQHPGSLMVGRWTSVLAAFDLSEIRKKLLLTLVPLLTGTTIPLLHELITHKSILHLPYGIVVMCVFAYWEVHNRKVTYLKISTH